MIDKSLTGPSTLSDFSATHLRGLLESTVSRAERKDLDCKVGMDGIYQQAIAMIHKNGLYTYDINGEPIKVDHSAFCRNLKIAFNAYKKKNSIKGKLHT